MAFSEQIVWLAGDELTVGFGFTVTVTAIVDDGHPFAVAVIVNVVVCGVLVVLVKVPVIVGPAPLEAIPERFTVLSLVQVNVVPATLFGLLLFI